MNYNIFCDIDGVLASFNGAYLKLTGIDIRGKHHSNHSFWDPVNKAGSKFWEDIEWEEDGKELWGFIERYKPTLLSAPSRCKSSIIGKTNWITRELPNTSFILTPATKKQLYANSTAILIDDRIKNIEEWKQNNGVGIVHTSAKETIAILKSIGL